MQGMLGTIKNKPMKTIFLFGLLILFQHNGRSCSIIPEPFCWTLDQYSDDLVISGVIVATDSNGIDIEILEVLRGEESRSIIRVWDGTDFECNGNWSMSASDIGSLYDTIVIILPKIIDIENEWDIIGDFRRPNPYFHITELNVEDGIVSGFISGDALAPPGYNILSMNYEEFRNMIITAGQCSIINSIENQSYEHSTVSVNNPFESILSITFKDFVKKGYLKIYSWNGHTCIKKEINFARMIEVELQDFPDGMFFLEIITPEKREVIKLVKSTSR